MNCQNIREQMELLFGFEPLPLEVEEHLASCADCRAYREELAALAGDFGAVTDIEFDEQEVGRAVALVDQAIAERASNGIISVNWLRQLTRVAAAVLIVAASWTAYRFGLSEGTQLSRVSEPLDGTYLAAAGDTYSDESEYIDDEMVSALLQSYAPGGVLGSDQYLIDDLTDEEMEYLLKNFDVGELL